MFKIRSRLGGGLAVVGVVLLAAACGEAASDPTGPAFTHATGTGNDPLVGHFIVCKEGTAADFTIGGDSDVGSSISLGAGECMTVATVLANPNQEMKTLTATEIVPGNAELVSVTKERCLGVNCTTTASFNGDGGTINEDVGIRLTFVNRLLPGGEGCTPGYWKQPHHFDSWVPTGVAPGDLFSSVFMLPSGSLANPEGDVNTATMTLVEALALRGGKINALIRHAVAAYLNASHPGVAYNLSPAAVVAAFNAAKDGNNPTVNGQKDIFADFNEQGCTLN